MLGRGDLAICDSSHENEMLGQILDAFFSIRMNCNVKKI